VALKWIPNNGSWADSNLAGHAKVCQHTHRAKVNFHAYNLISDRKVKCDGYFPTCINCTRAKRECVRSKIRLSWPKTNDTRRFITFEGVKSGGEPGRGRYKASVFLNTSHWDVTLQMELERENISRNIPLPTLAG
jgi:hypothetical protein